MQREKIPTSLPALAHWLRQEKDAERLKAILDSLRDHPANETRELLEPIVADAKSPAPSRLAALALWVTGLDGGSEGGLLALAEALDDGPVLAEALRQLGKRPKLQASSLLLTKLSSTEATVRAAAIEALAARNPASGGLKPPNEQIARLLQDKDVAVVRAAAAAAGKLGARSAGPTLLKLAKDADPLMRRASLDSLRLFKEPRAVPLAVAALDDPETQLTALAYLADLGGPGQLSAVTEVAKRNPSAEVLPLVLSMVTAWGERPGVKRSDFDRAVADLHGVSGVLTCWRVVGPLAPDAAARLIERLKRPADESEQAPRTLFGAGAEARLRLNSGKPMESGNVWLAYADCTVAGPTSVQFLSGSNTAMRIWLNGRQVHQRDQAGVFQPDSARFEATLDKGPNRVLVQLAVSKGDAEFHLRFRRKSSTAEQEKFAQAALSRGGNAERGRHLFLNADKSQCVKCHRLGDQGERIGPDLSGLGNRFGRIHIIESLLEPSRTVTGGYQTVVVSLKDGRTLTGIKVADAGDTLVLADNQGKKHTLAKADIDEERPHPASTMPDGLERQLTVDEFVDLIAFLASLKDNRPP